jgi:hypothetical protein
MQSVCAADVVDDCGHTAKNGQYVAERISSRVSKVIASVFSQCSVLPVSSLLALRLGLG